MDTAPQGASKSCSLAAAQKILQGARETHRNMRYTFFKPEDGIYPCALVVNQGHRVYSGMEKIHVSCHRQISIRNMQERMRHFSAHQRNSRTYRSSMGQPLSRQNEDDSSEYGKHTMTTLDRLKIEEALLEMDYGQEGWAVAVDGKHAISPHWIRKVLIPNGKKKGYRGNPSVLRKVMFTHSYRPRQHCISMWRRPKTTITLSPWTTAMLLFCKTRCPLVRLTRWSLSTIRFCSREITVLQRIAEGSQTRSTW